MLTVYTSHPFTGNEEENRKHARKLAADITKMVWKNKSQIAILNPCDCIRYAEESKLPYGECIDICLELVKKCDAMFLFNGWDKSRGCVIEAAYALNAGIAISVIPEPIEDVLAKGKLPILNNKTKFIEKIKNLIDELHVKDVALLDNSFLDLPNVMAKAKE